MDQFQFDRMSQGRSKLIERAFAIGAPSLRLKLRENRKIATARTDGTYLEYNSEWIAKQGVGQITFHWYHETMHCLMEHPWRIEWRDPRLANQAADYVINASARDYGFELPEGILLDPRFDGLGFEEAYAILDHEQEMQQQAQPQQGDGESEPGGDDGEDDAESDKSDDESGQQESDKEDSDDEQDADAPSYSTGTDGEPQPDFVAAPAPGDADDEDGEPSFDAEGVPGDGSRMSADDWKQLAAQMVMLGRKAGTMPAGLQGALAQSREARVRWQDELREFIERTIPTRRSWSRPNRRMLGAYGIVLPGTIKENCPELTVIVDTSGSTRSFLPTFADEFIGLAQTVLPSKITVISCDAEIHAIHTYEPDEYGEMKFDTSGGGGTAMSPAFDWINDQWEQPTAVIVLTDLEIDHPREPDYPVMFVTPEHCRYEPPFGRAIRIPPAH